MYLPGWLVLALGLVAVVLTRPALVRTLEPVPSSSGSFGAPGWLRSKRTINAALSQRGVADLVLLLAVGLLSGMSVSLTCRQIAKAADSAEASLIAMVVERQRRGQPLLDALHASIGVGHEQPRTTTARGPTSRPTTSHGLVRAVALLRSQIEDGAAVADDLIELAASLRDEARRDAETRARRLPVRMLLPLIVCVLPGFLCLTVAPVIIESLRGVSLQ